MGRIKFFKNTNASSNVLNEFVYSYNTANQITQITEPTVRTRTFGYDNADRLTTSTSTLPNQNESYTFDDVGNRTSSHLSSVYGYQQGSFNRLASTQQASYSFDNNGNLTSKSEGTAKWYYSYDRENRLMNAAKFGGLMPRASENINYQYDAFGRRVVRQDKKTGRTEFTHDGMDVIQDRFEKNDGSISTTNYVNGLGIDDKLKLTNGSTSRYFLTDHLGSTVGMADTNGSVVESATYDSFGRVQSGNLTTHYGYTGREADEKTGLMYYRARFYDPQIGRFTSEDPIGFAGGDVNLYGYVGNSPIKFNDPSGLQFRSEMMQDHREIMKKYRSQASNNAQKQNCECTSGPVEVFIWSPTVNNIEGFGGHVSYDIDGTTYSWENGGWLRPAPPTSDYVYDNQAYRSGTGYVLDFGSPEANGEFANAIKKAYDGNDPLFAFPPILARHPYNLFTNNCGYGFSRALDKTGNGQTWNIIPALHGNYINNNLGQHLKGVNQYPQRHYGNGVWDSFLNGWDNFFQRQYGF